MTQTVREMATILVALVEAGEGDRIAVIHCQQNDLPIRIRTDPQGRAYLFDAEQGGTIAFRVADRDLLARVSPDMFWVES